MSAIKPSFIREILKTSARPDIISFAGGLPNKDYFICQTMANITAKLMQNEAQDLKQSINYLAIVGKDLTDEKMTYSVP